MTRSFGESSVSTHADETAALGDFHSAFTENASPGFTTSGASTVTPPTGEGVSTRSTTTAPFAPIVSR